MTSPVGTVEIVNSLGLDVDRPVLPPLLGRQFITGMRPG